MLIGNDKAQKVLDIGCAEGVYSVALGKCGHEVTGIDVADSFLIQARQLAAKEGVTDLTHFLKCNIENEVVGNSYDWILFLDVIEHLESPIRALRNIRRSMVDSSKLIITTPNALSWNRMMFHFFDKGGIPDFTNLKDLGALHLQEYSLKTLAKLLSFAGFKMTRLLHRNRYSANLFVICQMCEPVRIDDWVEGMSPT